MSRSLRIGLAIAALVIVADQVSKYILLEWVMRPEGVSTTPFMSDVVVEVLPFFNFVMAWNTGISFSLLSSQTDTGRWLLVALQTAITAGVIWWLRTLHGRVVVIGAGLIIGGAIGNIVDRIRFGAVADFFDFHVSGWHFATFNVADCAITIGVGLWLLDALFSKPQHPANTDGLKTDGSTHAS